MKKSELTYHEEDNCGKKKFRLCKKDNYFKVSKKHIKLKVPVTDSELTYYCTTKISDDRLNAIVVQFLGGPGCTPDDGRISIKPLIPIKFEDIDMRVLEPTELLLVIFFIDENPIDSEQIDFFKKIVEEADDYESALLKIKETNPCHSENLNKLEKPREQDGDVIGGNA